QGGSSVSYLPSTRPSAGFSTAKKIADKPAAQAASVVFVAIRPIPMKSIADGVEPGLKPYQPNHGMNPPTTEIVRSCGVIAPPPSRLNLRPRRGPRHMQPANAIHPPIE